MTTLFDLTLRTARLLPLPAIVVDGVATGSGAGSPNYNTLVDATAWYVSPTTLPADDFYNGGTIWFRDCTASNLDGLTSLITDYVSSTGTITFTSLGAYQTLTGDKYSACPRFYPRFILRQAVNYGLDIIGGVDETDVTLTTATNTLEYSLPTGVAGVKTVEIATEQSSPYYYRPVYNWKEMDGKIVFFEGSFITAGYPIRLTYRVPFDELVDDDDTISDMIHPTWLVWEAVGYCIRWRQPAEQSEIMQARLAEALIRAEREAMRYRPRLAQTPRAWQGSMYWSDK